MPTSSERPRRKFPSQRSRGLVDRAMHLHLLKKTTGFHGPQAYLATEKLKARALRARRLLLERLAELEALAYANLRPK